MASVGTVVSNPVPLYSNPPIEPQFYQPSRFVIQDITLGAVTTITATADMNYVVGQEVRLLIPPLFGAQQLNNTRGIVLSIPAANQVTIGINSTNSNSFIPNALETTITGATKSNPCVLTAVNSFTAGNQILITGVSGMTQLNGHYYLILSRTATTITINVNSTSFTPYASGGVATLATTNTTLPQILAIGDVNTGVINSTGRVLNGTYIPGSFINISPQ